MDKKLLQFLKEYSFEPIDIDRLLVSSFVYSNNLTGLKNKLLRSYVILPEEKDYEVLLRIQELEVIASFENLIELFEFVISPSDKLVNGAVYTPEYIREYIVDNTLSSINELNEIKAADISCGCGSFLLTLAEELHNLTGRSFNEIYRDNLFGIDITQYSIERTKLLLSLYAISNGEDETEFNFNLFVGDSLSFDWSKNSKVIEENGGFDLIVGNPPYVCSRNMSVSTLELLKEIEVSKTGHPDLYIPFFQIGIENLNEDGILGFITVNTFIKSVNGRALRQYFHSNNLELTLLNFGGEQLFPSRNTYTCICLIKKGLGHIKYARTDSSNIRNINLRSLKRFDYSDLNHKDGWNLVNSIDMLNFIQTIENTGIHFKDLYNTKNGIATLKNDIYKFSPIDEDKNFYYLKDNGNQYPIEKELCRDIVNANKIKNENDIIRLREKIIFPYDNQTRIISENVMRKKFPNAYSYLTTKKEILSKRDKGGREYEEWYAFGRRQSMDINAYKLFFPHICERPTFVLCLDKDLLFYNGLAIVSENSDQLLLIKKILESDLFYLYIKNTTKDYSSGYISMSRNYLKNFGVIQLKPDQKNKFLSSKNPNKILEELYQVKDILRKLN